MQKLRLYIFNHYRLFIIILIIIGLIIGFSFYYFYFIYKNDDVAITKEDDILVKDDITINEEEIIEYLYVDIKGYVKKPGVYKIDKKSDLRINDLIILAGGLLKNADTSLINLSRKLEDEMTIIIYSKDEVKNFVETKEKLNNELLICTSNEIVNDGCLDNEIINESGKVNINKASKEELMTLPGIGESKALNIINYRAKNGDFKDISDIKLVSGIGDSLFEHIKEFIVIK